MFIVHNELDDGWMWVTNVRTEEQGLIVEDLVEEVVSEILFILLKVVNQNCLDIFTVNYVKCGSKQTNVR